jgi:phosphoesterase RecJ-like protein
MMKKIKELIESNDEFIILPHKSPDGDTIGSSVALKKALENNGKKGYIVLDDDIPLNLQFLAVEKYSLKTFNQLDHQVKVVITIDSSDVTRFNERSTLLENRTVLNIDHHVTNTKYGDINYVKDASSVGELIYELLTELDYSIDSSVANAIYVAISTDTGSFKYSNTSKNTFKIASKLRDKLDFELINRELYQKVLLDDVLLKNKVLGTLKVYKEKIGIVFLTNEMLRTLALENADTDGIVEEVRNINGISVAIFIKEETEDQYKVSFRSKLDFDVSALALEFNGGGHPKAAGCTMNGPLDRIIDLLVNKIDIR